MLEKLKHYWNSKDIYFKFKVIVGFVSLIMGIMNATFIKLHILTDFWLFEFLTGFFGTIGCAIILIFVAYIVLKIYDKLIYSRG
jgi:hypothetical protein